MTLTLLGLAFGLLKHLRGTMCPPLVFFNYFFFVDVTWPTYTLHGNSYKIIQKRRQGHVIFDDVNIFGYLCGYTQKLFFAF